MAMKFYSSTLTHHCPKCNTILKKEKHDDTLNFIYFVLFIPIGLIALIVHLIKKKTEKVILVSLMILKDVFKNTKQKKIFQLK